MVCSIIFFEMSCYTDSNSTPRTTNKSNHLKRRLLVPNPVDPKPFDSKIEETLIVTRHNGWNLQVLPNNFIINT